MCISENNSILTNFSFVIGPDSMPVSIPAVRLVLGQDKHGALTHRIEYYWRIVPFDSFFSDRLDDSARVYNGIAGKEMLALMIIQFHADGTLKYYVEFEGNNRVVVYDHHRLGIQYQTPSLSALILANGFQRIVRRENGREHGLLRVMRRGVRSVSLRMFGTFHGKDYDTPSAMKRCWFWRGRRLDGQPQQEFRKRLPRVDQLRVMLIDGVAKRIIQFLYTSCISANGLAIDFRRKNRQAKVG